MTPHAFIGDANGVTIRDLVIEKYATPAAMGAIHGQSKRHGNMSDGWRVIGNEIRHSASNGVHMGDRMLVKANYLHHNGLMGIGSSKTKNVTAEGNEIAYNCYASGLKCFGWEGGGVKFAGSSGATLRANYVHHNYGHGLWTDVQASNSTVVDNRVEHNYGVGILIEVSTGAVVHDNSTYENGHRVPVGRGAGIHVSSSEGVSIEDNTVRADAAGIVAVERGRSPGVYNLTVTNNTVISNEGWSGLKNSISRHLQQPQHHLEQQQLQLQRHLQAVRARLVPGHHIDLATGGLRQQLQLQIGLKWVARPMTPN